MTAKRLRGSSAETEAAARTDEGINDSNLHHTAPSVGLPPMSVVAEKHV